MACKVFRVSEEVKDIVKKLCKRFEDGFAHIDIEKLVCVVQEGTHKRMFAFVKSIKPPYSLLTDAKYFVAVIEDKFKELTDAQKHLVLFHELCHIPEVFDGKVIKHDLEDFKAIIASYGVNWLEDKKLEDILMVKKVKE